MVEMTTYGRFDTVALKSGPGSDWNEQVSLRVRLGDKGCAVLTSGDSVRAPGATRSAATLQEVSWI
jgi:hypothetical protein